jgi:hypothetical protein
MTIRATGRLGYWRTLPISGSIGMMRKTIAAYEIVGSVLPYPAGVPRSEQTWCSVTFGETMAKNASGSTVASPDGYS